MTNIGLIALTSGLAAQLLKVILALLRGRWEPGLVLSSGGMPSSHTATVTTLSILVGVNEGVLSPLFSVVVIFGVYVVFEATGLRQEVGKQASLLNDLVDDLLESRRFILDRERLREIIGHTWAEIAGGFVCGLVFALLVLWL